MNGFRQISALRSSYSPFVARVSLLNADLSQRKNLHWNTRTAVVPSYMILSSGFVTVRWILKNYIECFHMTSRRPYWCPKTMERRPCWCPKPILWELSSFLMQTLSFVPINLHRCWPREWKHSIGLVHTCDVSANAKVVHAFYLAFAFAFALSQFTRVKCKRMRKCKSAKNN